MDYQDVEKHLLQEAEAIAARGGQWQAQEVAQRLKDVADMLAGVRRQHQTGINASMGKRSGRKIEI